MTTNRIRLGEIDRDLFSRECSGDLNSHSPGCLFGTKICE
jgi:hypothetical protein